MIYADNAATTAINPKALEAMLPFMTQCFGNASSTHEMGQRASQAMTKARMTIARCLGASSHEISFTSGGTESDNQAILSAAALGRNTGKTHIITSAFEHHAVLNTMKKLETEGFDITYLDIPSDGVLRPEQIAQHITPSTGLVSVMTANNETGTIQPVAEIGSICLLCPFNTRELLVEGNVLQVVCCFSLYFHGGTRMFRRDSRHGYCQHAQRYQQCTQNKSNLCYFA